MGCDSNGKAKAATLITAFLLIVALLLGVFTIGCGKSEKESKQEEYRERWQEIMNDFEKQVKEDDKKAAELVEKNDLAGVIRLVKKRMSQVDTVMGKILDLYPPDDLRKLQVLTLFYLVTLNDQLESQNDLNDAMLSGKPTGDLQSIADDAVARSRQAGAELAVELKKVGIELESMGEGTEPQKPVPSSSPQE